MPSFLQVSFFSDAEETSSTPKADVLFVPRENPRALFIRQSEQPSSPSVLAKYGSDVRELATPLQKSSKFYVNEALCASAVHNFCALNALPYF